MAEPIEEIIGKIEKLSAESCRIEEEKKELLSKLKSAGKAEWDWVTVRKGCELLEVTAPVIYNKINSGKLSTKRIGSKTFVRKSELFAINDSYHSRTREH